MTIHTHSEPVENLEKAKQAGWKPLEAQGGPAPWPKAEPSV
jgi:hypothetical protein